VGFGGLGFRRSVSVLKLWRMGSDGKVILLVAE
jgi:hypothetical protein